MSNQTLQYYIDRYQDGSITKKEWQELQDLLKDPQYADSLNEIIEQEFGRPVGEQEKNDFGEVSDRIVANTIKVIRKDYRRMKPVSKAGWVAAASVILLLATGAVIWMLNSKRPAASIAVSDKEDILPGRDGAILTLSDGRQILLDTVKNGVIMSQAGVTTKVINGRLEYEGSNDTTLIYNTISTPRARKYQMVLPDGTVVWLNAASSINYPITFTGRERVVRVKGEVYFEVVKDLKRPFKVNIDERALVEVFGTRFNVNAYNNESETKITLLEGSVQVKDLKSRSFVLLQPGKQAAINNQSNMIIEKNVDADNAVAWKSSIFVMDDLDIETVMRQVSRWYNVEIVYPDGVPAGRFTGDIPGSMSLAKVLQVLELSGVKCSLEGRKVIVSK